MKTTVMFLAVTTFVLMSCTTDGDGGGTTFIPGFNATWAVENDSERQIDLQPNEENKEVPSGIFNGDEILLQSGAGNVKHPLKGSFEGLDIEFTIDRGDAGKVKYTGKMIPISDTNHFITRIELTSSEGNIALVTL